ncbi:uncharacterized protein [Drosophila tropicalis]|uniref:uncharacterized protein n=1 Tax=Drosophila tropicalis TaxID=46794 RepID=UPI0035AC09B4
MKGSKEAAKFKSLYCEAVDPSYGEIQLCELKAINRSISVINFSYYLKGTIKGSKIQVQFLKRNNGWHPFLYDIQFDTCDLIEKNKPYLANLLFSYVKPFMNINRTCPKPNFVVQLKNYQFDFDGFHKRFPVESGEYGIIVNVLYGSEKKFSGNATLMYSNYRE